MVCPYVSFLYYHWGPRSFPFFPPKIIACTKCGMNKLNKLVPPSRLNTQENKSGQESLLVEVKGTVLRAAARFAVLLHKHSILFNVFQSTYMIESTQNHSFIHSREHIPHLPLSLGVCAGVRQWSLKVIKSRVLDARAFPRDNPTADRKVEHCMPHYIREA